MTKNRNKRLGCVVADGLESAIRVHSFFRDLDWDALENRRVKPPFKPKIVIFIFICITYIIQKIFWESLIVKLIVV